MEIIINGQQLEFSLESEKTVGDVLKAIESDCAASNATIISILIDDNLITESNFEKSTSQPLDFIQKIQLETMSESDVIFYLSEITKSLTLNVEQLLTVPVLLQSNKDAEASSIVMSFVDGLNSVQKLAYFFSLFPKRFNEFTINNQSLPEFLQDFTPILQEFEASLVSKDTVLTGDLAEYEIVPKLQAFVDAANTLIGAIC